jgi:N-acetyl-anhydromuramyl-L-alanine amidase AmpD
VNFVQARNFTRVSLRRVDLIVIHSMESQEKPTTAESVASWFAGATAPRASAHFCIDSDSIVQCVKLGDVAWHAPGANHNGIGLEHAGRAAQTFDQWMDDYGRSMIELSARLSAWLCKRFDIPVEYILADELRRGEKLRGITTHDDVSRAFKKSTHTDPGPGFPLEHYIRRVASLVSDPNPLSARSAIGEPA